MTTFLKPECPPAGRAGLPRGPGPHWVPRAHDEIRNRCCGDSLGRAQPRGLTACEHAPTRGSQGASVTSWGSGPLAGCGVYTLDSGILPLPLQGLGGAGPASSLAPRPALMDGLFSGDKSTFVLTGTCCVFVSGIATLKRGGAAGAVFGSGLTCPEVSCAPAPGGRFGSVSFPGQVLATVVPRVRICL